MVVIDGLGGFDGDAGFRRRLLDGLAASITDRGYRATTITDIVGHARTSKRTFYNEFADKQECFIALMRTANDDMVGHIRAAVDPEAPWQTQIHQGVGAYLDRVDATSPIALSWIRDLPTLGPLGQSVQRQNFDQLTEMMVGITKNPGFERASVPPATRSLARLLLGGVRELSALVLEEGSNVRDISDTAITATLALLNAPSKEKLD